MNYKGYEAKLEFDEVAGLIHGEVVNISDVVTFQATDTEGLVRAFHESVDEYLAFCQEIGRPAEKPFSGKFLVRMDPEIHREVCAAAALEGKSVNAWAVESLADVAKSRLREKGQAILPTETKQRASRRSRPQRRKVHA